MTFARVSIANDTALITSMGLCDRSMCSANFSFLVDLARTFQLQSIVLSKHIRCPHTYRNAASFKCLRQRARRPFGWICPTKMSGMMTAVVRAAYADDFLSNASSQFAVIGRAIRGPRFGFQTGLVGDQLIRRAQNYPHNSYNTTGCYESSRIEV
jgi:hypothetical protein